jgi:hypothetical protein
VSGFSKKLIDLSSRLDDCKISRLACQEHGALLSLLRAARLFQAICAENKNSAVASDESINPTPGKKETYPKL